MVYGVSNTTTEDMWMSRSISIVGSSQSSSSSRSLTIQAIVQEQVESQTTQFTAEITRHSAEMVIR
jgi:hypothetical protein